MPCSLRMKSQLLMAQKCRFDNDDRFLSVAIQKIEWRNRSGGNSKESHQSIFGGEA